MLDTASFVRGLSGYLIWFDSTRPVWKYIAHTEGEQKGMKKLRVIALLFVLSIPFVTPLGNYAGLGTLDPVITAMADTSGGQDSKPTGQQPGQTQDSSSSTTEIIMSIATAISLIRL